MDRIQERISLSLRKYDHEEERKLQLTAHVPASGLQSESVAKLPAPNKTTADEPMHMNREISFETIKDPMQLYELLTDTRLRSKYERRLMIALAEFEHAKEEQERLLRSLDEFFIETQTSNQAIDEMAAEQVDFSEATSGIESALGTATEAASRLVEIKQEMAQLLAVMAQFSDNKKGRRKLEKALVKAQEDAKTLTNKLGDAHADLEKSKNMYKELQKTVEFKTAECTKLRNASNQVTVLQSTNEKMKKELADAIAALETTNKEMALLRNVSVPPPVQQLVSAVDDGKVKELEDALVAATTVQEELAKKIEQNQEAHKEELAMLQAKHEEQLTELQTFHREQMQEQLVYHKEEQVAEVDMISQADSQETRQEEVDTDKSEMQAEIRDTEELHLKEASSAAQQTATASETNLAFNPQEVINDLQAELKRVQEKSSKTIISLNSKLAESENKLTRELGAKDELIASLQASVKELEINHQAAKEQLMKSVEQQKDYQQEECQKHLATISELEMALQQMKEIRKPATPPPMLVEVVKDLADHSTQWSRGSSRASIRSLHHEIDRITSKSTPLHDSSLMSVSAANSIVMSEISVSPPLPLGSAVSLDEPSGAPHVQFPGMSSSKASKHESKLAQDHLSSNHPIITEWSKTFELFRKFYNGILEKLASLGRNITELSQLDSFSIQTDDDLIGQITQKRFTLTLALHQLETSLHEHLAQPDHEITNSPVDNSSVGKGSGEVDHLKLQVSKLQQMLKQKEDQYHSELTESKNTITNLSLKVESLKTELTSLHHRVAREKTGPGTDEVTFFTKLDVERNEKALQQAVTSQQISEQEYSSISSNMREYLSIPIQRLATITHQLAYTKQSKSTINDVSQAFQPRHAAQVIGMIEHLRKKRQEQFEATMEDYSIRRKQLSNDLQIALTKAESKIGLLLIKPIFPVKTSQPIIVPLNRIPPATPSSRQPMTSGCTPILEFTSAMQSTSHTHQREAKIAGLSSRGGMWSVYSSCAQSTSIPCSPVLPRIVELETRRVKVPGKLLKHVTKEQESSVLPLLARRMPPERLGTLPPVHISLKS